MTSEMWTFLTNGSAWHGTGTGVHIKDRDVNRAEHMERGVGSRKRGQLEGKRKDVYFVVDQHTCQVFLLLILV